MTLVMTLAGALLLALGPAIFVRHLIGAWRGTGSDNLEYGVMPAMAVVFGLFVTEYAGGWPGWPPWVYGVLLVTLPVALCAAVIWASKRARARR